MKLAIVLSLVLVCAGVAQQQGPPGNPPPYATPPTFPDTQKPTERMPPDTKPSDRQRMSTSEVESQIQDKLKSEPILASADVGAKVDARTVTLTGTVSTEEQHDVALRIAQSYAGERKLVDKLQVQSKT